MKRQVVNGIISSWSCFHPWNKDKKDTKNGDLKKVSSHQMRKDINLQKNNRPFLETEEAPTEETSRLFRFLDMD